MRVAQPGAFSYAGGEGGRVVDLWEDSGPSARLDLALLVDFFVALFFLAAAFGFAADLRRPVDLAGADASASRA